MQGATNGSVRQVFARSEKPDTLFTEFIRIANNGKGKIQPSDRRELAANEEGLPLVVQLIGHDIEALCVAAQSAVAAGVQHLNLNAGCPFGRMGKGPTGGGLLHYPEHLIALVKALRAVIPVSFSVKLRAGYDRNDTVLELLSPFEEAQIDYLILHPRTVAQAYKGAADHRITAEVVRRTSLPVIANGDIRSAEQGWRLLEESGAAGLMLGRGAFADPRLFSRLRRQASSNPNRDERWRDVVTFLEEVSVRYIERFCGEQQILSKLKAVVSLMDDPALMALLVPLKRSRTLTAFQRILQSV